jgi:succinylglutamate desuccinylase
MTKLIQRVAIVGGTHGNEWTGIYLVKKFQRSPILIQRPSFESITLLANPEAIAANRRYIDRDLNRCFSPRDLVNSALTGYEDFLAKEIAQKLSPKNHPKVDVILDLHSTTANMGITLILSSKHLFNLQLAAYLNEINSDIRVCFDIECDRESPRLRSLCPWGCTIEVGAIPQNTLNAELFHQTETLIHSILDYLEAYNLGQLPPISERLEVYQAIGSVDYPRNLAGELQAAIHPELQNRDYEPLHPGDSMFLTWDGYSIPYRGESIVFPVFVNEAAYYEKGIAMVLTQKQLLKVELASDRDEWSFERTAIEAL